MTSKPEGINKASMPSTNKSKFNSKQNTQLHTHQKVRLRKKYGNFLSWWQEMDGLHQLGLDFRNRVSGAIYWQ